MDQARAQTALAARPDNRGGERAFGLLRRINPARGARLGLIGFGVSGQEMAVRAHFDLGMQIFVHDSLPLPPAILARARAVQVAALDDLLAGCDVISLHGPARIGARALGLMRADAQLINTGAPEWVDARALAHALWFGTIAGAGLGAFCGALAGADNLRIAPPLARARA